MVTTQSMPDPIQPQLQSFQERVAAELGLFGELTAVDPRSLFFATPCATKRALGEVPVSEAVPDDARALIQRVASLLMYAYLNYELNDVASEQAFLYLESILRMRLGMPFRKGERASLRELVRVARKKGLIPARYTDTILEAMRDLRNHSAHAGGQQLIGPILAMSSYYHLVDMTNCLYDEVYRCAEEPRVFSEKRKHYADLLRQARSMSEKRRGERPGS